MDRLIIERKLPAGLIDDDIEIFNHPINIELAYCLTNRQVYDINDAPEHVLVIIDQDMAAHPEKMEALVQLGYETQRAQREKYCSCCFGAFDGEADIVDGLVKHNEYWPCPLRGGHCPVEGILCNALTVGDGQALSKREIDVLILVGRCDLDKEIADKLRISEETVKVHKKHIFQKSGLQNKQDLVKLAIQKNLITI